MRIQDLELQGDEELFRSIIDRSQIVYQFLDREWTLVHAYHINGVATIKFIQLHRTRTMTSEAADRMVIRLRTLTERLAQEANPEIQDIATDIEMILEGQDPW